MSVASSTFITPEQYLRRERLAETKSEYFNGEIFPMPGGTPPRQPLMIANAINVLQTALASTGCQVYSSDLRICVSADGLYTYPDVSVIRGDPQFIDHEEGAVTNPKLIIEVLSDFTREYDRGRTSLS